MLKGQAGTCLRVLTASEIQMSLLPILRPMVVDCEALPDLALAGARFHMTVLVLIHQVLILIVTDGEKECLEVQYALLPRMI